MEIYTKTRIHNMEKAPYKILIEDYLLEIWIMELLNTYFLKRIPRSY